jgi:alpha-beta hydrolase superfamily lysophospholipase
VFLNVANQHHVGPNRLWVELARQWAAAGVRSLRLDLSGLGDSPNRQGERGPWECFKPEAFDDVVDAVRWASPDDPSNVVLVGLCSGGYQALESALTVRARGAVAINPFVSFEPAEVRAGLPLDPRRRILLPDDDRDDPRPDGAWRARSMAAPGRSSGQWLSELVQQGTDTLLVCGDAELSSVRRAVTATRLHRLSRTGGLRLEHLPGLQHALFIADQRRLVTRLVTEHVLSRFPGPPRQRGITGPSWARALDEEQGTQVGPAG